MPRRISLSTATSYLRIEFDHNFRSKRQGDGDRYISEQTASYGDDGRRSEDECRKRVFRRESDCNEELKGQKR